jgi:hypothetical protein
MRLNIYYLLFSLILSGCSAFNKEELAPAFIEINAFNLKLSDPTTQGTESNKIEYVWVFIDDNTQGAYQLPVKFPVLNVGKKSIKLSAGVRLNGLTALPAIYPFYTSYTLDTILVPENTLTLQPKISYQNGINLVYNETFESGMALEPLSGSVSNFQRTTQPAYVFEGNFGAFVEIDANNIGTKMQATIPQNIKFPGGGRNVFAELNYKNNVAFTVGVIGIVSGENVERPTVTVNPSSEWNKIYINLTYQTSELNAASRHIIYITALHDGTSAKNFVAIDNFKIIY